MTEQESRLPVEVRQYANDHDTTPNYAFAILYLSVGSVIIYLKLAHSNSGLLAWYERLWNNVCFVVTWPICILIKLCTSSIKNLRSHDSHERGIYGSLLSLLLSYTRLWSRIFDQTSLKEVWFPQQQTMLRGPPGLGNLDNSCFQNAVIQVSILSLAITDRAEFFLKALASLSKFEDFLKKIAGGVQKVSDSSTTNELRIAIAALNDPSNAGRRLWVPRKLKSMNTWQQQDAQEYLSQITEHLEKELKLSCRYRALKGLEQTIYMTSRTKDEKQTESKSQYVLSGDESYISKSPNSYAAPQNPMDGLLAQRVGCRECDLVEEISLTPFRFLTVSLGNRPVYNIDECLYEYTALEIINGLYCVRCTLLQARKQLQEALAGRCSNELSDRILVTESKRRIENQLSKIENVINESLFADTDITRKCKLNKDDLITSSKTRQTVIARPPQELIIHINRSIYDEIYGIQYKNLAKVRYPMKLDLQPWILGQSSDAGPQADDHETWSIKPNRSLLADKKRLRAYGAQYTLRAVISHFGRHENGHYVCYRRYTNNQEKEKHRGNNHVPMAEEEKNDCANEWWRLSDDEVSPAEEVDVLNEGCVFMLFYESIEPDVTDVKGNEEDTSVKG